MGVLEGEDVDSVERHVEYVGDQDYISWIELSVGSDYFSCGTCCLVLDGYELIEKAGLPNTFEEVGDDEDFVEPDYGND